MNLTTSLQSLNDKQQEAVIQPLNSSLILAGAGSGKTSVLVHRIAYLVEKFNVSPFSIMAVTFTNKAASEMKERVLNLLDTQSQGMWIGTFHSLSHRILRFNSADAGLASTFTVIDSDDQLRIIKRIVKDMRINDSSVTVKQIQWYINGQKDEGLRAYNTEPQYGDKARICHAVYLKYELVCKQESLVDFGELLLKTYELLRDHRNILEQYQSKFSCILVDEFQDTNALQYAWLKVLYHNKGSIMVVGDDDQSIYWLEGGTSLKS